MSPTIAAPVPEDRSLVERLYAWQQTDVGRFARYVVEVGVVAAAYYGAAKAGLHLAYLHGSVTALWPPVGIGIAALVILGPGVWPAIVIGDLLVADFSSPWGTVLGQTLGNTLEVVVAAVLFLRLAERRIRLERVWDVLALVVCAALGTLVSATFGVVSLRLGHVIKAAEFGSVFRTWWLADFSGALVFAPLLLVLAGTRSWRMPRAQLVEGALLLAILIVLIEVPSQQDVPYIVFPVLIRAALRFGPLGAATTLAIVSSLTVWNTAHGSGPFLRSSLTHSLLASQLFVAVAALTSLVLAAVTAERAASQRAQQRLTDEQPALRRIATLVAGEAASKARLRAGHSRGGSGGRSGGGQSGALRRRRHGRVRRGLERERCPRVPDRHAHQRRRDRGPGSRSGYRRAAAVRPLPPSHRRNRRAVHQLRLRIRHRRPGQSSADRSGARSSLRGRTTSRFPRDRSAGSPTSRSSSPRHSRTPTPTRSLLHHELGSSRRPTPSADRLERNLHDGAQQRLVSLALQLRVIKASLRKDPESAEALLVEADNELDQALGDLRELARGIHPAVLTDRGLAVAIHALAERAPVPIELARIPEGRLPNPIEAAIYYLVAEAVTNVAKYAQATRASIAIERTNGIATVVVSDDGIGGAEPVPGSGLVGLADRVEALGGRLHLESPPGRARASLLRSPATDGRVNGSTTSRPCTLPLSRRRVQLEMLRGLVVILRRLTTLTKRSVCSSTPTRACAHP